MKEIIEKLQPYLKHKQDCNIYRQTSNDMDKGTVPDCDCGFDQALSLLKARLCQPECEICGDTKMIYGGPYGEPCPTCQPDGKSQTEEIFETTKEAMEAIGGRLRYTCVTMYANENGIKVVYPKPDAGELEQENNEIRGAITFLKNHNKLEVAKIISVRLERHDRQADLIERQAKNLKAYTLLEEMAPPDMPRKKFVKMLWDAWRENNNLHHQVEQQAERIKMLSIGVLKPGSKEMKDKWEKELRGDG